MKLVIEDLPGGLGFRLYGGSLSSPVTGKSVEDVLQKAAHQVGVTNHILEVSSAHEMAQVLESMMGKPTQGQIITGLA